MRANQVLASLTFLTSFIIFLFFLSVDTCLDAGGVASNLGINCSGTSSQFVPLYKRPIPMLWVICFAAICSTLTNLIVKKVYSK